MNIQFKNTLYKSKQCFGLFNTQDDKNYWNITVKNISVSQTNFIFVK